jgi:tetratricopeptide (TPR) repeat protein
LAELFAVTPDSSQYNERERQGMFYAESWLLTHFLTAGDIPAYKMRFQQFTPLLRQGQVPEQAFTNALQTALPVMDAELARYLQRGRFAPIRLLLPANVASATALNSREITPVETFFLLGNELLRIDRLNEAESYFRQAQRRAPASPLPYEGLALLAARREKHAEALSELEEALTRGSISFLAHYLHAQEKYRLTADSQGGYSPLKQQELAALRGELRKSIALMPNFAPAHQLLGFLEMVQCEDLALAEQELQLAIQLEPDNPSYLLSLAQVQLRNKNAAAARRTLEPLLLPNVESTLRAHAREMLEEIGRERPGP